MKTSTTKFVSSIIFTLAIMLQLFAPSVAFAAPMNAVGGPTVTIVSSGGNYSNLSPWTVTITFSEDVTNFYESDISVSNTASTSNFSTISASVYTFTLQPQNGSGTYTVSIAEDVATASVGGLGNVASAPYAIVYDISEPSATLSSTVIAPTGVSPIPVTITFNEEVVGFALSDLTVNGGTAGNLQTTDDIVYTFDITPSADGILNVRQNASSVQDLAGNWNNYPSNLLIFTYDATAPSVAITSTVTDPTETSPIPVTITFDEEVLGFDVSDITVGNGAAGNFDATNAPIYTADITPAGLGTVTVDVAAAVAQDAIGHDNNAATQYSVEFASIAPTLIITSAASPATNVSLIPVTFTFSEAVTGFDITDISVGNGSASNFDATNAPVYTADVTATAEGNVTVDVAAAAAADLSANDSIAAVQFSIAYDLTSPTAIISTLETEPTNNSPFVATITFSEDVIGFEILDISVTNGSASNFAAIGNAIYTVDITPLADGPMSINVNAGSATDIAGNSNSAATQYNITYDATAPTVVISSAESDPTNANPIPVTFTFDEDVTGFELSDITVVGGTAGNFGTTSASVYTADITPDADGIITVDVPSAAAADLAGNGNAAATQFSITSETVKPIASLMMGLGETASNTSPLIIGASFSKVVTGFTIDDLVITNGTAQNFTGSGDTYEFEVVPTAEGLVTIQVPADVAQDSVGNLNTSATLGIDYDLTSPTLVISTLESDPTSNVPFEVTFTFDEDVTGFELADITVGNGSASNFTQVSPSVYTADITSTAEGAVTVDVAADVASDMAGNFNTAATQFSITFAAPAVTVAISSGYSGTTSISPIPVTITFSENVTGFVVGDISVGNGTAGNFAGSGSVYTADITPTTDGIVTVDVAAAVASSVYLKDNAAAVQFSITYDTTMPSVVITSAAVDPTKLDPFSVTITFSENVTGFTIGDISVGNGTASNFAGSGSVYTANINPTANGEVTVDVAAGVAQAAGARLNAAATQYSITFDGTRPTVIVSSVQSTPTNDSPITITIAFSEAVTGLAAADFSVTNGTIGALSGSGSNYTLEVTPTASGFVTVTLGDEQCSDAAGNLCNASIPYTIAYDITKPGLTITSPSAGNLTFTFTEAVTGFAIGDIAVSGATLSNFSGSGAIFTAQYTLSGSGGTVSVPADVATDAVGNTNTASNVLNLVGDTTAPSLLSINRLDANPTKAASVRFAVTFSEPVNGLDNGDLAVVQSGVSGATISSITGSSSVFTVTLTTGTGSGTLELRLSSANNIEDLAGNPLAAVTVASQAYNIDRAAVGLSAATLQMNIIDPTAVLSIQFNEDVYNPAGNSDTDDVTNPNNFILLSTGADGVYNTISCAAGVSGLDVRIPVNSVSYNNANFTASLSINNGLPLAPGRYRLLVCGTTSITDLAGNSLNNGNDVAIDLVVWNRGGSQQPLPVTGVAPNTALPAGSSANVDLGSTLRIPAIDLNVEMVMVPLTDNNWDVTWLGDKVGVLAGPADLSMPGNTIITGHNWDYGDVPGPFLHLSDLAIGDEVSITNAEGTFTFVVTENKVVDQYDLNAVFIMADEPTITLITCDGYNDYSKTFTQRRVISAVLK